MRVHVDRDEDWQRTLRIAQSWWREEQGYRMGFEAVGRGRERPLGSRLPMPWARRRGANFCSDRGCSVARRFAESLPPGSAAAEGLWADLLSPMALAMNAFGPLVRRGTWEARRRASPVFAELGGGEMRVTEAIRFGHSPGPRDPRYTGDDTRYDVFVRGRDAEGAPVFLAIVVAYHDLLPAGPRRFGSRHRELLAAIPGFERADPAALSLGPLAHLLAVRMLVEAQVEEDGFDDARLVLVAPSANRSYAEAVAAWRTQTGDRDPRFLSRTLEEVCDDCLAPLDRPWATRVRHRYLDLVPSGNL